LPSPTTATVWVPRLMVALARRTSTGPSHPVVRSAPPLHARRLG
jgi:hypothetical protein